MYKNPLIKISNIFLFFIFFIAGLFYLSVNQVFALEISLPGLSNNPTLPQYVSYFFNFGIYVVGILSLISFTVGAVSLIVSFDKPDVASNAKDRMKGAILGLILTIISFIIMNTINPAIITPLLNTLPNQFGIFYTNGSERKPCPTDNQDTSNILNEGFNNLEYVCNTGPAVLVWVFNNPGLENGNNLSTEVSVKRMNCGDTIDIGSTGSFKIALETPGIYYCLGGCGGGDMCSGYMSNSITGNENNIVPPFAYNISGIRIVNDAENKIFYGALFHKEPGLQNGGECSFFIMNTDPGIKCLPTAHPENTGAVDVFKVNLEPVSSGNGVNFYSTPYGWDKGSRSGYWIMTGQDIADIIAAGIPLTIQNFNYINIDRPSAYPLYCKSFQNCPGSIKINGQYLVIVYSTMAADGLGGHCQTFIEDVPNLNVQEIIAGKIAGISYIIIIPTK